MNQLSGQKRLWLCKHVSRLSTWDTHLPKSRMERAETQQGGDNRSWRKHVSTDPCAVDDQSWDVWKGAAGVWSLSVCRDSRWESDHGRQWKICRSKPPLRNVGFTLQQPIREKRPQEKCGHIMIPLLNLVALSLCNLFTEKWKKTELQRVWPN